MPTEFLRRQAGVAVVAAAALTAGCATPAIEAARENYRRGDYGRAEAALSDEAAAQTKTDRVPVLFERGMARHAQGRYEESSRDWIEAAALIGKLETYSVSRGATSLLINDRVQAYRGVPFEWSLLHALTALNHFALARWDDGAVEARRTIEALDLAQQDGFPADAFSAYVAGVAMELIDDPSNAALLYRRAAAAAPPDVGIDDRTGRLFVRMHGSTNGMPAAAVVPGWTGELICFALLGQRPPYVGGDWVGADWSRTGYVELRIEGRAVGRTYSLSDVARLSAQTEQRLAALRAAKTAARIALKNVIAESIERGTRQPGLGNLIRLVLIGLLERPDDRRWATLPRHLQVARVPCPDNLDGFEAVFRAPSGAALRTVRVTAPLARRRTQWMTIVHDRPPERGPALRQP